MNDLINWIAMNNTLMIRIGFTAILGLLIFYIFRLFFVPKVNIVAGSLNSLDSPTKEETVEDEKESVSESPEFLALVDEVKQKNSEIESLIDEATKLKTQLSESETQIIELQTKVKEAESNSTRSSTVAGPSSGVTAESKDDAVITGLKQKVEQLESRLSEYEIIADEISEIGELRKENAELKKRLGEAATVTTSETDTVIAAVLEKTESAPESVDSVTAVIESTTESNSETKTVPDAAAADSLIDDFLSMQPDTDTNKEESVPAEVDAPTENEVVDKERDLIDQFEKISNKKES